MANPSNTPHDRLFKATFSIKSEAVLFVRHFLPKDISLYLDLASMQLENASFTDKRLKNHFSDIIYSCKWNESKRSVWLTFLFEHKSHPEQYPELQLLRYMLECYESQLKQKKELSLILPIVLYHGKGKFNTKPFFEYLELPHPRFGVFMPSFEFIMADLSRYADEQILAIGMSFLTSSLLLFKHKRDKEFVLNNYREIFIFVENYKSRQETERFLETLILYVYQSFAIEQEEINEIADDLPKNVADMFASTYDKAVERGETRGIRKGELIGIKKGEQIGIKKGEQIGIKKGEQIGIKKGEQIGIKKGEVFKSFDTVFGIFSNSPDLNPSIIAEIVGMEPDLIKALKIGFVNQDTHHITQTMSVYLETQFGSTHSEGDRISKIVQKFFNN
ncbi:MAG: Rpn family recombination-promoting nuclease/putative transposase [Bacteroidota bacterium]